ncbi:MAG: class I SAM-dependent methyltransferase [Polyangiaceae bacterium]
MRRAVHWEEVYKHRASDDVSWYRPHLERSLAMVESLGLDSSASIVDIGGGASTFVDDLLARGFSDLTVLDLSESALAIARERLGERAAEVRWIAGDATKTDLGCDRYDVWHDRAVFHFLTDENDRRAYIEHMCCALRTGGHVVLSTFAPDGPERCSGLPVARYGADELLGVLGEAYELVETSRENHETPKGTVQSFTHCLLYKTISC